MEERPRPEGEKEKSADQRAAEARKHRVHRAMRSWQSRHEELERQKVEEDSEDDEKTLEERAQERRREVALDVLKHRERRNAKVASSLHGVLEQQFESPSVTNDNPAHEAVPLVDSSVEDAVERDAVHEGRESLANSTEVSIEENEANLPEEALELPAVATFETGDLLESPEDNEEVISYNSTGQRAGASLSPVSSVHIPMGGVPTLAGGGAMLPPHGGTGGGIGSGAGGHGGGGHGGYRGGGVTGGGTPPPGGQPPIINVVNGPNNYYATHNHNIVENRNIHRRTIAGLLLVDLIDYVATRRREGKIKKENVREHAKTREALEKQRVSHEAFVHQTHDQQAELERQVARIRQQAESDRAKSIEVRDSTESPVADRLSLDTEVKPQVQPHEVDDRIEYQQTTTAHEIVKNNESSERHIPSQEMLQTAQESAALKEQKDAIERLRELQVERSTIQDTSSLAGGGGGVGPVASGGGSTPVASAMHSSAQRTAQHDLTAMPNFTPHKTQATSPILWISIIVIIIFLFMVIIFAR